MEITNSITTIEKINPNKERTTIFIQDLKNSKSWEDIRTALLKNIGGT